MRLDPVVRDTNIYHAGLSEAEREADYKAQRANEIEREAVDYFGGDLLNLDDCETEADLLNAYKSARDIHADTPILSHKIHALAQVGRLFVEAMNKRAAKLADEYVEREL